jgi:hypothetical protein
MCSSSIENAATKSCTSCGADLARWSPRPATPPPLPATVTQAAAEMGNVSSASGEFNLGLGVAGAVGGAIVGMGLMYGFYATTGLRFPLLGCGTGLLSGLAARWLFKGTDHTLGIISAVVSMIGVLGALVLMYGVDFSPLNIISIAVSASVAYKIATR